MKYRQRQLSEFFCREMLYDFATGTLDEIRTKAIKESLKEYPDLETEFQSLQQGLSYTKALSQTQISPHFLDAVLLKKSVFDQIIDLLRMHKWKTATVCFFLIGVLLYGSFFEKIPHGILWTTNLIKSSEHPTTEKEKTKEATTIREIKPNTKAKSIINRKNNASSYL